MGWIAFALESFTVQRWPGNAGMQTKHLSLSLSLTHTHLDLKQLVAASMLAERICSLSLGFKFSSILKVRGQRDFLW